jgi:hypothetical protein
MLDIGLMKLSAITSRAEFKDYVDIFFILKHIPLQTLLDQNKIKHSELDQMVILKSLTFFEDINTQKIIWQSKFKESFEKIKVTLVSAVRGINLG